MALSLKRWFGLSALACAVAAVALLPPKGPSERRVRSQRSLEEEVWYARSRMSRGAEVLRLLDLTDSLLEVTQASVGENSPVWLVDERLPTPFTDEVAAIYEAAWERLGSWDTTVTLTLVMNIDSALTYLGYQRAKSYDPTLWRLPVPSGTPICLVGLNLNRQVTRYVADGGRNMRWVVAPAREAALGACAYYAAFGLPGKHVAEWLERWRYVPIRRAQWHVSWDRRRYEEPSLIWPRQYARGSLSFDLVACAGGERDRCRATVHTSLGDYAYADSWMPEVLDGRRWYLRSQGLGPRSDRFFSDMVAEFGRERFAKFWTSNEPLEDAFAQAMDIPLDQWTMEWAQHYIGVQRLSAHIPASSVLTSLVLMGVLVGGAGVFAIRRQVS